MPKIPGMGAGGMEDMMMAMMMGDMMGGAKPGKKGAKAKAGGAGMEEMMMEMMMGDMMSDVMGGPPKGKKGGKGGMGMGGGFMDMMGDDYDEEDGDLFGDDEYDSDEIEMIGKQMGLSKKELAELKRDLKSKYNAKLKNEEKKPSANASKK